MHLVIFEGNQWRTFAPLALSRPVFMLATGMATLLEKQIRYCNPSRLTLWVRPELEEACRSRIVPRLKVPTEVNRPLDDEPALIISGRTLHFRKADIPSEPAALIDDGGVVRKAWVKMPGLSPADAMDRTAKWRSIADLPPLNAQTRLVEHLWDLIHWNEESLIEDFAHTRDSGTAKPAGAYHMIEDQQVWLGDAVRPGPGAVLDASLGPVTIDHHASIGANAVIQGPCYIGPHVQIKPLTQIRAGTSIGAMCKVGGEVSASILFGYSNKAHDGFLGDSYVGKWVNIGAATTVSNLKNTYGEIALHAPGGAVKTGRRFLGALIGDHAKLAIGTRLKAGSYVGFASMVAVSSIAPGFIPSFRFLTDGGDAPYRFEKAIEVMKAVFGRRDRSWDPIDQAIVEYVQRAAPSAEGV
jgi:UDP-N-acetylglucosamine diphosphorylase/glucosamine-1-phosphate N-acetyltransferase